LFEHDLQPGAFGRPKRGEPGRRFALPWSFGLIMLSPALPDRRRLVRWSDVSVRITVWQTLPRMLGSRNHGE